MADHARARARGDHDVGGYWPLAVGLAVVLALVGLAPSRIPSHRLAAAGGTATEVPTGQAASGWGTTVTPCTPAGRQDPDAAYSPPCFAFSGDNGGATARGVTGDTIDVSYRLTAEGNIMALLAELSGLPIDEDTSDLQPTAEGLVDYFNETYQFYGRRIALRDFQGRGQLLEEIVGGGQEGATNDALKAAQEVNAFADVSALTPPYADALARNEVIGFGAPYMSREWFRERRPYAWSPTPDCTTVGQASTEYLNNRLAGRPAAFAGPGLRGEERRIAVIAPDNLEYQQCVDTALETAEAGGGHVDLVLDYVLDMSQAATQASSILAKLRDGDITSVACYCDPLLVVSLTGEARAQDYTPEWLVGGVGFTDLDLAGRLIASAAPGEWDHAFGVSPAAALLPARETEAYRAYKSVRDDEPSMFVDVLYQQLLPLAIGVQMAGPDLTPETLETGMWAYPEAAGMAGTWDWRPDTYTPVVDVRELWWDPDAISAFDGLPGSYRDRGERYRIGEIPPGDPEVFE